MVQIQSGGLLPSNNVAQQQGNVQEHPLAEKSDIKTTLVSSAEHSNEAFCGSSYIYSWFRKEIWTNYICLVPSTPYQSLSDVTGTC